MRTDLRALTRRTSLLGLLLASLLATACRHPGAAGPKPSAGSEATDGEALAALERACGLEGGLACYQLGRHFDQPNASGQELVRAANAYETACRDDIADGCAGLGYSYLGRGRPVDAARANALFRRGCDLGEPVSCHNVAVNLVEGKLVDRNLVEANALFRYACDQSFGPACGNLGLSFERGRGVETDLIRAAELYARGCELGHGVSCGNLGLVHARGLGVPVDSARAAALYEKACTLGSGEGCSNLGSAYQNGLGVARDVARAIGFQRQACGLKEKQGCLLLGLAHEKGGPLPRDPARAAAFYEQACKLGEAIGCSHLARRTRDQPGGPARTARALATLAREFPEALSGMKEEQIFWLDRAASRPSGRSPERLELLEALFLAKWQPEGRASSLWADLAVDLLDRGLKDRAAEVLPRVTDPHELASLRVDARAAELLAAHPGLFDVDAALVAEVARRRTAVERAPRSLEALSGLLRALAAVPRHDEALQLSTEALRRHRADASSFSDAARWLPRLMEERALALEGLGRWQEALDQQAEAARLPEAGGPNVSQAIDLAVLLCALDRPSEALAQIKDVRDVSPYGRMQIELVRLLAAVELGDQAATTSALTFLREHRADSRGALQHALIAADRLDEAARVMVERLLDPASRRKALLAVQQFDQPLRTPRLVIWHERWVAMVASPEVQAAIARVGRIERFRLAD